MVGQGRAAESPMSPVLLLAAGCWSQLEVKEVSLISVK